MYKKLFLLNFIKLMAKESDGGGSPSENSEGNKEEVIEEAAEVSDADKLGELTEVVKTLTESIEGLKKDNDSLRKENSEIKKIVEDTREQYIKTFNGDGSEPSPKAPSPKSDTFDMMDAIAKSHV